MKTFKFKDAEHSGFFVKDDQEIISTLDDRKNEIYLDMPRIGKYIIRFSSKREAREEYERFMTALGVETKIFPTDKEIEEEARREVGADKRVWDENIGGTGVADAREAAEAISEAFRNLPF